MNGEQKIALAHLRRRAVIYVRESSDDQVKHHLESQQLQYALAPRAKGLEFCVSSGFWTPRRRGFCG
jgi:hypothetical protein